MDNRINLNQARELLEFFGGEDADMTVGRCGPEAHSGPGLYVWCTEHPEEGSMKLDEEPATSGAADTVRLGRDKPEPDPASDLEQARALLRQATERADFMRAAFHEAQDHAAAAQADAARYRWLRSEHERVDPVCHLSWKQNSDRTCGEWVNTANLDASIDRAMATGEQ